MTDTENLAALSENALASLMIPNLINPVLDKMEKEESIAVGKLNLRNAFAKIDAIYPMFTYDLVNELLKAHNKQANMNEIILRSEKYLASDGKQK